MFDEDSVEYTYAQWDGTWSVDQLSEAAIDLFSSDGTNGYFISWETGTIEPKTSTGSGMGGAPGTGFNGPASSESSDERSFAGPADSENAPEEMSGEMPEMSEGMSSGMNSSAYHMASFDYAYNCVAVMEWLFQQSK